jgi:hypothetical protein
MDRRLLADVLEYVGIVAILFVIAGLAILRGLFQTEPLPKFGMWGLRLRFH